MHKIFPTLKHVNLPNLITAFSIGTGLCAYLLFLQKNYRLAVVLYALTLLFDRLDGLVARRFKAETEFGRELDSLADAVNFVVFPALMAYSLGFNSFWAVCALYLYGLSGVWRLANYNLEGLVEVGGKNCFTGICTTHAGALVLLAMILHLAFFRGEPLYFMYPLFILLALLMNSSFKYDKNGWFTISLYVIMPAAVIMGLIKL
ncbi:CDP-alcohol phosphatidyltransferase family protein [Pelotomaculum terephthalicicum JT]|uniref:CDP-alcohol phosphatidyltransferase family protein n=1 Tax=Pelotomaculum terephthalicicum TaxID=206393 RepID=UPI0009D1CC78|nr:CDP-alcohol phosphatidyltransferase family protein [Pelotomaculum terephthalicicum]MCG9969147.1 CDP-alcohol phosphatidyltransferase family protein [Pelotomaculum terephthalicicum JT]OPX92921.1 MAG: phosphatidylglycerophosphate synthetase [Pelotomaculum sp. PtaB.Bin104]